MLWGLRPNPQIKFNILRLTQSGTENEEGDQNHHHIHHMDEVYSSLLLFLSTFLYFCHCEWPILL